MPRIEIEVNGVSYPCEPTMGSMLRFKEETGKEINEINLRSFTELCVYLWCCVVSGAKREKKEFNLSLMDFADALTPDDMAKWQDFVTVEAKDVPEEEQKKSPSGSTSS